MRLGRSAGTGALVATLAVSTVAAQIYGPLLAQGSAFTDAMSQEAEASLKINPRNLAARTHLIGYYSAHAAQDPAMRAARLGHIEWLIENDPATPLLRIQLVRLQPSDFSVPGGASVDSFRRAWQQQVDTHSDNPVVIENAVRSLGGVEVNTSDVGRIVGYLQRLRVIEPGDPEWALELAGLYAFGVARGLAPNASADTRKFASESLTQLDHSSDAAVVGLAGAAMYEGTRTQISSPSVPMRAFESMLRNASTLNPQNPGWVRLLDSPAPKNSTEFGKILTETLQVSDLWPGGKVPAMPVPEGAIERPAGINEAEGNYYLGPASSLFIVLQPHTPLQFESLPPMATGAGCSVRFNVLIGSDGHTERLQVAAFNHLNIPFVGAARDALRQAHFEPAISDGKPAEVVTHIDMVCPKQVLAPTTVVAGGVPGGVSGGLPGGVLGGILGGLPSSTPPTPPPARQNKSGEQTIQIGGPVMAGRILKQSPPVYPELARKARIQGVVRLDVLIGKDGVVETINVIDGYPLLRAAAIDAVKQWVYQPTTVNGEPVKVHTQVEVNFTLSQ